MKTIFNIPNPIKAIIAVTVLIALAVILVNSVNAQKKDNPSKNKGQQPQVSIKVDKQTDKNGNVTRYDSTYSYSWSGQDNVPANIDSMMRGMQEHFKGMPLGDKSFGFDDSFFNDSVFLGGNFKGMFDNKHFADLQRMMAAQEKLFQQYFKQEPFLKVPDGVAPQQPKKKEKKEQQDKSLIQNNNYSTTL